MSSGVSNEARFVFTVQSIVMSQKLKGTLTFIVKVSRNTHTHTHTVYICIYCTYTHTITKNVFIMNTFAAAISNIKYKLQRES